MKTLNIKDPEAHRLAAAIAHETGESLTRVVTESLRERLNRLPRHRRKATAEELKAMAHEVAKRVRRPHVDHAQLLYDKSGLPK